MSDATTISTELRKQAQAAYHKVNAPAEAIANALGLFPSAVDRVMSRDDWTIERGVRVLNALGYDVKMSVVQEGGGPR